MFHFWFISYPNHKSYPMDLSYSTSYIPNLCPIPIHCTLVLIFLYKGMIIGILDKKWLEITNLVCNLKSNNHIFE